MVVGISLVLPVATSWLGFEVVRSGVGRAFSVVECVGAAFPVGVLVSACVGLILNSVLATGIVHYLVQVIGSFAVARYLNKRNKQKVRSRWASLNWVSLGCVGVCVLWCVLLANQAIFPRKDEILKTGANCTVMEFSLVNSFYRGVNRRRSFFTRFCVPLDYKIRMLTEMITPFYTALLRGGSANMKTAMRTLTDGLMASACLLMYCLTKKVVDNEFLAVLSVPTLFLVGGFGFVGYADPSNWNDLIDFQYMYGKTTSVPWGHPLLHCLLPSRILVLSLVDSLLVFLLLEYEKEKFAACICIAQVLVRPHSAFALALAMVMYRLRFSRFKCGVAALVMLLSLASVSVFRFTSPLWGNGEPKQSLVPFLSFPYHVYGTMFLALFLLLLDRPATNLLVAPTFVFYVLCFVQLQPDARFNFMTTQTVVTPLVIIGAMSGISWFLSLWKSEASQGIVTGFVLFIVVLSWLSSLCGIANQLFSTTVISGEETNDLAKWITRNTRPKSIFYAQDFLDWNPAVTRSGRLAYIAFQDTLSDLYVNSTLEQAHITEFKRKPEYFVGPDYFLLPKNNFIESNPNTKQILDLAFSTLGYSIYTWKHTM